VINCFPLQRVQDFDLLTYFCCSFIYIISKYLATGWFSHPFNPFYFMTRRYKASFMALTVKIAHKIEKNETKSTFKLTLNSQPIKLLLSFSLEISGRKSK
jgi:hypothetical protein